jgi:hypothetical protein
LLKHGSDHGQIFGAINDADTPLYKLQNVKLVVKQARFQALQHDEILVAFELLLLTKVCELPVPPRSSASTIQAT